MSPSASVGLDDAEARDRLRRHGPNLIGRPRGSGWLAQAWRQLITEPMFLLLLGAAALYLLLGDRAEGTLLGAFALLTVLLVLVQNQRSRRSLDALRALAAPQARVLRGGTARRIPASEVVPGDWLLLEEGERIAADGVLREAHALAVDESLLTGESLPVTKAVEERVAGGTMAVTGHGAAEVTATGLASQAGRIGAMLEAIDPQPTRLQRESARMARRIGVAAAAFSGAVALLMVARGHAWSDSLLTAIALSMALLPEEFALATTVFFVIGAWRLAQHSVLTRRPAVVETLGAATVLAVDKTGTLTENRMRLRVAWGGDQAWDTSDGSGPPPAAVQMLREATLATREHTPDPLDLALRGLSGVDAPPRVQRLREYPVATGQPYYVAVWQAPGTRIAQVACKGAAEAVLELCELPAERRQQWRERAAQLSSQGLRVLGVARTQVDSHALPTHARDWRFEWLGLIGFEDPLRSTVQAAVRLAREAGVAVLMVTGDAAGTALSIARQAGLDTAAGALLGRDLDAMDDATLAAALRRVRVFARVNPTHKLRLVRALQAQGEVVAMTGDGVNDAPALRAAHVGVGMGARGTDVAREASSLVLLDDDFGSIVEAVSQGRRIFDNLRKVMLYIVAIHVPVAGLAVLPLLAGLPPMLLPAHVALTELVIDPMCSLGYEALPAERDHMRRPPRRLTEPLLGRAQFVLALAQGALLLLAVFSLYVLALRQGHSEHGARFLAFAALTAGNLGLALVNTTRAPLSAGVAPARPFFVIVLLTLAAAAASVTIAPLARLFSFAWPGAAALGAAVLTGLAAAALCELAKRLPLVARGYGAVLQ